MSRKREWWVLKRLSIELPYDPAFHLWVYTQKNLKQRLTH